MDFREIIKMVLVLMITTGFWGGALSLVKKATEKQIEYQRIKNIKAPAIKKVLTVKYDNDPVKDRIKVEVGKDKRGKPIYRYVFLAKRSGKLVAVAIEGFGTGYKDKIGVMVSILLPQEKIGGIAITTHSETPGVGTRAMTDEFMGQFKKKPITVNFTPAGGVINAVSGATYTSNGIMMAVQNAVDVYKKVKSILKK